MTPMTPNNNNIPKGNIPTLRATFDPTNPLEGMFVVSLVEDPAIGSLFFPFGEEKINLSILDAPQHKVIGCVLRADYHILRIDGEGKYYNLIFDKETIYKLTQHFVKYNNTGNVSVLHNGVPIGGVELTQLFIKDKSKGIDPVGFDEVSDGSLFAEYKILNEEVWKGICNGVYRGFSIEGVFEVEPLSQKFNEVKTNKVETNKFNIFNMSKLRDKLAKMLLKFDSISTDKADLFYDHEGELVVGDEVYTYNEAGDRVPVADGEYLSDNIVYDIENSKVDEIKRFETPDPVKEDLEAMPAEPETPAAPEEMPKEEMPKEDPKVADPKVAELESKVTELESKVTELVSKVEELTAKVETPVVDPIAEVFSAATTRTNDSRATRLAELGSALR